MIQDLSQRHEPISGFLNLSLPEIDEAKYRLTEEEVQFFHEQGYLSRIRILDEAQVDHLREELVDLFDPQSPGCRLFHEYHSNESTDPSTILFHALGAWRIKAGFHDLLWHPAFTVPASQLLGGSVRFWHDQLFCKPAKHGGVVAWHQDYSYWTRTQPMAIELKKGEASFHHPLMVHGSFENHTEQPRRGTVINALRDGVRSVSDEPLLAGVPVIAKGEKVQGQFFPLLREQ